MKFATKSIRHCPPHLRHVATLPWEIENSKFLGTFLEAQCSYIPVLLTVNLKLRRTLSLMIYHLPEQISLKTRSSCTHYIIICNLLLQFTQFIHYPLLPLVFYHLIVLYIRAYIYMSILTASL